MRAESARGGRACPVPLFQLAGMSGTGDRKGRAGDHNAPVRARGRPYGAEPI